MIYSFTFWVTPFRDDFGVSTGTVLLAATLGQVTMGLYSPVAGRIMDAHSVRLLATAGILAFSAGYVLIAFATDFWQVLAVYCTLLPVGAIFAGGMAAQVATARWFEKRRGAALGISSVGTSLGGFVFPPIVTALNQSLGWRESHLVFGVAFVLIMVPIIWLIVRDRGTGEREPGDTAPPAQGLASAEHGLASPEYRKQSPENGLASPEHRKESAEHGLASPEYRKESPEHSLASPEHGKKSAEPAGQPQDFPDWKMGHLARNRAFWYLVAALTPLLVVFITIQLNTAPIAEEAGILGQQAALLISTLSLAMIVGKIGYGFMADKTDHRLLIWFSAAIAMVSLVLLQTAASYIAFLVAYALVGISQGGIMPTMGAIIASRYGPANFGRVGGLIAPLLTLTAFGPVIFGYLRSGMESYGPIFQLLMLVVVPSVVATYFLGPNGRETPPEQTGA
ncbi:MFS transporter [Mangrovimicrobium sediminis]|uniref:MFS transporter n=2 Tax=Mangrovimicrobium sediminis TaxID=2562682 RepID=A0A4Z0M9Y7_9GAMM|nr:MFS transporter [Haliea sp. SAOS-164]